MAGRTKLLVEHFYSRKIIGGTFCKIMDAELAVKVLRNTALNVKHREGIIIQSYLDSQFIINFYESALAELKIRHSYSRKTCPYDNACIESFHSVLKKEEINFRKYKDAKAAYNAIANCLLKRHPEPVKRNHIDEHSQQLFASKRSTCAQ